MTTVKKTRSALKREAIINAAKQSFKEYGVAATSMDKVAEVAQVSKRTVYNHFSTKEALVMHLLSELWMESLNRDSVTYDSQLDIHQQLHALLLEEINFISQQEYIDIARMAVGHLFYDTSGMKKEMQRLKALETAIQRWIKAAIADGKLDVPNFDFASDQLFHLLKGECFWAQVIGDNPPLSATQRSQLADETARIFLARYQVQPGSAAN